VSPTHIGAMQKALISCLAAGLVACGTSLYPPGGGTSSNNNNANNGAASCDALEDGTFASVEDQSLGQRCEFDQFNNYQCTDLSGTWSITFDNGDLFWDVGNQVASGTYTCSSGNITAHIDGETYHGTLTGTNLTWDGLRYRQ
jgi:hypothetical protein